MKNLPPFTFGTLLCLLLVAGSAAGVRVWYLSECAALGDQASAISVQGPLAPASNDLVANLIEYRAFDCVAPLADEEEPTAHVAPGYVFVRAMFVSPDADYFVRWLQCALGSLTAICYFLFARRAFHGTLIATLAGLLAGFHPFWIISTAELNDGVLATFLVSACLAFGARGGQVGGPLTGFAFGLALAGASLVRAALLPFAIVSLVWLLWECRRFPLGWLAGLLAVLAFMGCLAPWAIRNYLIFEQPIPVVDSTYLHLWMGNNPNANGGIVDPRQSLPKDRLDELLAESKQPRRYNLLASDVCQEVQNYPAESLVRRIKAALTFLFGERWFKSGELALISEGGPKVADPPEWLRDNVEIMLQATLLGLLVLAFFGWRWSYPWRRYSRIGVIALLWIPLPYILSHAEAQSGPRLPLDGVLLCYAAFAIASMIPGLVRSPNAGAR